LSLKCPLVFIKRLAEICYIFSQELSEGTSYHFCLGKISFRWSSQFFLVPYNFFGGNRFSFSSIVLFSTNLRYCNLILIHLRFGKSSLATFGNLIRISSSFSEGSMKKVRYCAIEESFIKACNSMSCGPFLLASLRPHDQVFPCLSSQV